MDPDRELENNPEYQRILAELSPDDRLRLLGKDFDLQRQLHKNVSIGDHLPIFHRYRSFVFSKNCVLVPSFNAVLCVRRRQSSVQVGLVVAPLREV